MLMRLPRILRTSSAGRLKMSWPWKSTSPETMRPGGLGMRRMTERFVTDLPDPDSPTMPSVSPRLRSKLMPSTALTVPSSVSKYVRRSLTERRFPLSPLIISVALRGLLSLAFLQGLRFKPRQPSVRVRLVGADLHYARGLRHLFCARHFRGSASV